MKVCLFRETERALNFLHTQLSIPTHEMQELKDYHWSLCFGRDVLQEAASVTHAHMAGNAS